MSLKLIFNPFSKALQYLVDDSTIEVNTDDLITNDMLIGFRSAINGSFSVFQMLDGIIDDYQDETGIDTDSSTNELFDSGNDLYSPDGEGGTFNAENKLVLNLDGTDGATSTIDESESAHSVTFNGNAQLDTAQKFSGESSLLLDGNGDYLSIPDSDDWNFGSGDFTVDFRMRVPALPGENNFWPLYQQQQNTDNRFLFMFYGNNGVDRKFYILIRSGGTTILNDLSTPANISINTWYHIALVRNGNNWLIFQDGVLISSSITSSITIPDYSATFNIGGPIELTGQYFNGWIDNFRVRKGIAAWTSGFTPPTGILEPETPGEIFNMTLISETFIADTEPTSAQIVLLEEDIDSITLNTDLKAYVSRDGGSTYTQGTLSYEIDFDSNTKVLIANVDLSSQPSGTSMVYKIETLNTKNLSLHATALSWK